MILILLSWTNSDPRFCKKDGANSRNILAQSTLVKEVDAVKVAKMSYFTDFQSTRVKEVDAVKIAKRQFQRQSKLKPKCNVHKHPTSKRPTAIDMLNLDPMKSIDLKELMH